MSLEYVNTKEELPVDSDFTCCICLENIDLDDKTIDKVPNCVICAGGHRLHNVCFQKLYKLKCPLCESTFFRFCKSKKGYSYVKRLGGKKRKTNKKRKICKKMKTKNNRRLKC